MQYEEWVVEKGNKGRFVQTIEGQSKKSNLRHSDITLLVEQCMCVLTCIMPPGALSAPVRDGITQYGTT
jgi:hypothetical protein